jgi:hypothetical protein
MARGTNKLLSSFATKHGIKREALGNPSLFDTLDFIFREEMGRAHAARAIPSRASLTAQAELVGLASAPSMPPDTEEWLAGVRRDMGLPEEHANLLYLSIIVTHTGRPMENAHRDIITAEEAARALPSMTLQPVDISFDYNYWDNKVTAFDHHARPKYTQDEWSLGENGIRGVIYAARIEGDAIQVGAAIWARDFPEIAELLVEDAEFLGASFDLVGDDFTMAGDSRQLMNIEFRGCTILYRHLAADRDTAVGDVRYMGEALSVGEIVEAASKKGVPVVVVPQDRLEIDAAAERGQANPAPAAEKEMSMTRIEELEKQVSDLESALAARDAASEEQKTEIETLAGKVTSLTEVNDAFAKEVETLRGRAEGAEGELAEIKSAIAKKELTETRMGELDSVGAFESEEARAAAEAQVADMDEKDFTIFAKDHKIAHLERLSASAQAEKPHAVEPAPEIEASAAKVGALTGLQPAARAGLASLDPEELRAQAEQDIHYIK